MMTIASRYRVLPDIGFSKGSTSVEGVLLVASVIFPCFVGLVPGRIGNSGGAAVCSPI